MERYKDMIEAALQNWCENAPEHLRKPLELALLSGGHRIRPILTLAWCEASGGRAEDALPMAVAVELVHTMSLIHDDLPCMDGAMERRGLPALHTAHGEAVAVLTGDILLSEAFGVIAGSNLPAEQRSRAVTCLSNAAAAMAEAQAWEAIGYSAELDALLHIHAGKAGALMEAACVLGAMAADASGSQEDAAARYGMGLGVAYQIMDDLRDGDGVCTLLEACAARDLARAYLADCTVSGDDHAQRMLRSITEEVAAL